MTNLWLFLFLFLYLACGKNSNEVEGQTQAILSVTSLQNTYPEIIGFRIEHMDHDPLSRGDLKTTSLSFTNNPYSLTQWIVENVFFRFHYEPNGFENFNKLNRLQNGVILPLQQSFFDYLQKNNQLPNMNILVDLKSDADQYDYFLGFVSVKNLDILPQRFELYRTSRHTLKSKTLNIDQINQLLQRDFQPVIFWEKSNRSRLNVYVVEEGDVRTIELNGTEKRDLLSILNTDLSIVNFNEYSEQEKILDWNPHQDFWICFPCDANKIGSFGSAYLVKTNVASLIKSNRRPGVAHAVFPMNKDFIVSDLKPFDQVHVTLNFIERIPKAIIPRGVAGSNGIRDCINTSTVLSHYDELVFRPSQLLSTTFIDWKGELFSLRDFFSRENITYTLNQKNEIEFSLELEDFQQFRLVNKTHSRNIEVIFSESEMICGDRTVHQWPRRVESHASEFFVELKISIDGLSR